MSDEKGLYMRYSFEQIKNYLQELLEKCCEPELSLWIDGKEYMIILYPDFCSFAKCGERIKVLEFKSLDDLYLTEVCDGIVLQNDWNKITRIECSDFHYLNLPTEIVS